LLPNFSDKHILEVVFASWCVSFLNEIFSWEFMDWSLLLVVWVWLEVLLLLLLLLTHLDLVLWVLSDVIDPISNLVVDIVDSSTVSDLSKLVLSVSLWRGSLDVKTVDKGLSVLVLWLLAVRSLDVSVVDVSLCLSSVLSMVWLDPV